MKDIQSLSKINQLKCLQKRNLGSTLLVLLATIFNSLLSIVSIISVDFFLLKVTIYKKEYTKILHFI